jgi:ketosteroid isomerase-like protein
MAQDNVEIARRGYEAFNEQDADGLFEFIDPEIEYEVVSDGPTLSFSGTPAVQQFIGDWLGSAPGLSSRERALEAAGLAEAGP